MRCNSTRISTLVLCLSACVALAGCDYLVSPETRLERARAQVAQGNYREALVDLKNALQKEPNLPGARLLLADVALWLGDPNSAASELQRVPAGEEPSKVADAQVRIDLMFGRYDQAIERSAALAGSAPASTLALYRGQALLGLRRPAEAEAAFREAVREDPELVVAQVGVAEALAAQGQFEPALSMTQQLVQQRPDSAHAWVVRGLLLARSDATQAVQALERAQSLAQKQLPVTKQIALVSTLGELQLAQGSLDAARASSQRLTRMAPGSPIAVVLSSRIAMASNDYVTASSELRRLVNVAPGFVQARFMLGVALAAQGNLEQASQELSAVVERAPELVEARELLARVRMRLDDPDGALRVLVPGLEQSRDGSRLTALMSAVQQQAGASQKTVEFLEAELAKDTGNEAIRQQLAWAYLQGRQAKKALNLLRSSPGTTLDVQREALMLHALIEVEGVSAARARADALLAAHPDNPDLLFASAQLQWKSGQIAEARSTLEKVLKLQPGDSKSRFALAEIELVTGRKDAAVSHLEALRSQNPKAIAPRLLLARIALVGEDAKRAADLIAEALSTGSGVAEIRAAAGDLYLEQGRYDQAIEHYRAGVKVDPSAAPLWLSLGRAQLAVNQHAAARESLEKALALRPQWIAAEGALTFLDLQAGNKDAALQRVANLKTARPKDPAVLALEGQLRLSLREYREAAAAFESAAQLQATAPLAISASQARLAAGMSRPTEPLERWIAAQPEDIGSRSVLAEAYVRMGERRKAAEQYELIVARQPRHVGSINNLAWLYFELNDKRAIETAQRASAAAPDSPAVSDTLGWILVENGRVSEGLPILERASGQAGASTPEIAYHYAAALVRSGNAVEGRRELEGILKKDTPFPSRPAAERLLAELAGAASPTAGNP